VTRNFALIRRLASIISIAFICLSTAIVFTLQVPEVSAETTTSAQVSWTAESGQIVEISQNIEPLETSTSNWLMFNFRFEILSQSTNLNLGTNSVETNKRNMVIFFRQIADYQILSRDTSCSNIAATGLGQWMCTTPFTGMRQRWTVRVRRENDPLWWEYSVRSQTGELAFGYRFAFAQVTSIDPKSIANRVIGSGTLCDDGTSFAPATTRFGYPKVRYSEGSDATVTSGSLVALPTFGCGLPSRMVLNQGAESVTVHFGNSSIPTTTTTTTTTTTIAPVVRRSQKIIVCISKSQRVRVVGRNPKCPTGFRKK